MQIEYPVASDNLTTLSERIEFLWSKGFDTLDIAQNINFTEAFVYNHLANRERKPCQK